LISGIGGPKPDLVLLLNGTVEDPFRIEI